MLEIVQIPVLMDNYVYLLHCSNSGKTAVVDPAVDGPVIEACTARGWRLTDIFNTHHHPDHVGANTALKDRFGLKVTGPAAEAARIPGIDRAVGDGDQVALGSHMADVFDTPGHTAGHIVYHFAADQALFCGDTLFALGCGRLFEGTPAEMWTSLARLKALPDDTRIYCAHEYTAANADFALSVEPGNAALVERVASIRALRAAGKPTVPSLLREEKATNPFLRPDSPGLQKTLALAGGDPVTVFAETRARKDRF